MKSNPFAEQIVRAPAGRLARRAVARSGRRRPSPRGPPPTLTPAEQKAAALVKVETIREVTTGLTAKEMEGRGTAQPGGERAAKYIADRFAKLGLKPLGDAGTYLQAIQFKSTQPLAESTSRRATRRSSSGPSSSRPRPTRPSCPRRRADWCSSATA